jgi:decaprenylphospho-beta-D-erythro-pentofuranosid-2-ulose 2-reductase
MNRKILILGATSAIAEAYGRLRAAENASLVLVARDPQRLQAIAQDLRIRGAQAVHVLTEDLSDTSNATSRFQAMVSPVGGIDEILVAYGVLGDQIKGEIDPKLAEETMRVNYLSVAIWIGLAAEMIEKAADKRIVAIGSVAGDRGRASNYIYGSAKAGLDAFLEGLAHRLAPTGVKVITVKPGPVDTPMTGHLPHTGPPWSTPDRVAADIKRAVDQGARVVYTPRFWRLIMFIIRNLPRPIFYRTKL